MTQPPRVGALQALLQRPLVRRVMASTGSNAYAQATTIAMQLLSLPLFLAHWDISTYGQWLVLSALPSYLAMADGGMLAAAGNRMTMLMGDGKTRQANAAFQSALAFVLGVGAVALPLVALAAWLWPGATGAAGATGAISPADASGAAGAAGATLSELASHMAADPWQTRGAVLLLSACVIAALVGGLPEAVYKSTQRYALGAALANTTRLLEWLGGLAGLWWGGSFIAVAAGGLLLRVLCTAGMAWHAARTTPALRWGFADASRAEIRHCAGPAISFMAFPAANALNFQGMTLIAAAVLGPAATVVFNTYRTLARVTVQATAVFSLALWPEFSRIYGQGRLAELAALYRRSRALGLALAAGASLVVYLVAPTVLHLWAGGRIAFEPLLMLAAMVYAASAGAWHVSRVLLLSTNEHAGLAWPYLLASAASLPLAWLLAQALGPGRGLIGIVLAMLALELAMLALCSWLSRRLLQPPVGATPFQATA